jgi:hypothetical protein
MLQTRPALAVAIAKTRAIKNGQKDLCRRNWERLSTRILSIPKDTLAELATIALCRKEHNAIQLVWNRV